MVFLVPVVVMSECVEEEEGDAFDVLSALPRFGIGGVC